MYWYQFALNCYLCRCLKKVAKSSLYLNKCQLYVLSVYMKDELRFKCLSVGMSGPNEVEQEPIQGRHLFAMPPGKSCSVINYIISIISYSPRKNKGIQAKLKIDHIIPRFRPITPTYLHRNYVYLYFYFFISHCNIARLGLNMWNVLTFYFLQTPSRIALGYISTLSSFYFVSVICLHWLLSV